MMLAALCPAWAAEWMTDLEAAKAKAAAENKAVLIDFTGSDWCGWCIRLRQQVLDTPAFEAYAKDKFVLMEVDVPNNPKFDPELRKRNEKLCEQFSVDGFPTIMVITPQGEVVGGFGGFKPTVEATAESLNAALATADLLKKAETQQGAEQLATLVQAYKEIPDEFRSQAAALRLRIIALDPQDTTGVVRQQRVLEQREALAAALPAAKTPAEALTLVDKALTTAEPENKPGMLQLKFQILLSSAQSVDDVKAAAAVGREAIQSDPKTAPGILQKFETNFSKPEEVLQRVQRMRSRQQHAPQK